MKECTVFTKHIVTEKVMMLTLYGKGLKNNRLRQTIFMFKGRARAKCKRIVHIVSKMRLES